MIRTLTLAGLALATAATAAPVSQGPKNAPNQIPAFPGQTRVDQVLSGVTFTQTQIVSGLQNPWGIDFLPDGRAIVTEKPGRLRVIDNGVALPPVAGIPVVTGGQGGLLDVAVIPATSPGLPYSICYTYASALSGGKSATTARCAQVLANGANIKFTKAKTVFSQTPSHAGQGHYGSRIVPAPDGTLYITTGDRQDVPIRDLSQQLGNGIGKVMRVTRQGLGAPNNPWAGQGVMTGRTFAIGHRNMQGAAINPISGKLWTIEHGPRGGDELNAIDAGENNGWPVITYGIDYNGQPINGNITQQAGMSQPLYYWDPVIAPGGILFYTGAMFPALQGDLLIASLGRGAIVRLGLNGEQVTDEEIFPIGPRVRDLAQAPDGSIWIVTDESNGRVIRLTPGN